MKSTLIISKSSSTVTTISEILRVECGYDYVASVSSAADARTFISENSCELVVLCTPSEDEFGCELGAEILSSGNTALVIIANEDAADKMRKTPSLSGAFVLSRPLTRIMLIQAVQYVKLMRSQMLRLKSENAELERKLDETKIIDRAKCMLIQYLRISEEQAHKHIQKQAMNKRVKQIDVAIDILKTYEN